jgi:hypothetical protein
MLLSAVSFLVVAQSISEVPEGLMNNPVYFISITDRVMFQAAIHQTFPTEILFRLRPILVGFVVYKLALGQAWLRVLYTHTFIYQRHYIISTLKEPLNKNFKTKNEHSFCRALFLLAKDLWKIQLIFQIT